MRQTKSTTVMIFLSVFISSITFFKEPFEGYFHYIIFLLLLPGFMSRFGMPKKIPGLMALPLLAGILGIFMGNNTWDLFLKIFIGVLLSASFYGYVMEYFEFDTEKIFGYYRKSVV